MKLIECVPNFSEGKNEDIISAITNEITLVENINLLDVDSGADTNRTVVTFVGSPEIVVEAAFNAIKKASELIDMRNHLGEHPRMGATDVCPLIPVSDVSMKECIKYSKILAQKVSKELNIPIFLYEESANTSIRRNLANIRKGEYEGMKDKIKTPGWKPDYGKNEINLKSGVTAIGARNYLIAYNINLNSKDRKIASDIALDVRELGRAKRDLKGKIIRDSSGKIKRKPGKLKSTKAVGWYIDEYKKAQVSMNLTNYKTTSVHAAFEEVRNQARKRGLRVTGSEIVGLIPKEAIIDAGMFYLEKQNKPRSISEEDIIHIAVESLGLNDISTFNPDLSIVENRISTSRNLINLKVAEFSNEVSSDSPAPGGGSVSALSGSLSASLVAMVSNLTFGKKEYENKKRTIEKIGCDAQKIKKELNLLIDSDTDAFNMIMESFRLPKKTIEEKAARDMKIEKATINAIEIPFKVMELSMKSLKLSKKIAKIGNKNSLSDSGVSSEMAFSAINGAYMNVLINLKELANDDYVKKMNKKSNTLIKEANKIIKECRDYIFKKL